MKAESPCTSFAPGRALPLNECETCGHMRIEHLEKHRSTPTGHQGVPPVPPADVQVVPRVETRPDVVYCRACSAGLIIHPPTDPDTYRCPQCGHVGPKSKSATAQMPDEKVRQRETPALVIPAELQAIADEHERQRELDRDGSVQYYSESGGFTSQNDPPGPLELLGIKPDTLQSEAALPPQGDNDNA